MNQTLRALVANNRDHAEQYQSQFDEVQETQRPDAVTVCCSDSRVLQDHMWQNNTPGHLFTSSNIGNRVIQRTDTGDVVSGDVLYPVVHTGTELVIVVGHTGCGAVTAAYDDLTGGVSEPPGITHCIDLLTTYLAPGVSSLPPHVSRSEAVNRLVEYNVDQQIEHLQTSESIPETVTIAGVVYDFQDVYSDRRGEIHVTNINGTKHVEELRANYPEIANRIRRLWEY